MLSILLIGGSGWMSGKGSSPEDGWAWNGLPRAMPWLQTAGPQEAFRQRSQI